MEKEGFDPKGEQYKEVADLPPEHQEEFMDVKGGGFVSREAIINVEKAEWMAHAEENKRKLKEKFDIPPEKIKILNLSEFIGKRLSEVEKYVMDTYGSNYNIPRDEYLEYLMKIKTKFLLKANLKMAIVTIFLVHVMAFGRHI